MGTPVALARSRAAALSRPCRRPRAFLASRHASVREVGELKRDLRLAVVGTSNAVLRDGYVPGLEASSRFSVVRRHSVGGSPSALLAVVTEELNPSDYDVCLIDTAINDDVHFNSKCQTLLDAHEQTLSFMRHLATGGCMPFLLCMHELDNFARRTPASEMYRALAERFNCGHYDARWFFSSRTERGTLPLAPLFRDKAHPNAETSLSLGRAIGEHIAKLPRPWSPPESCDLLGPSYRLLRPAAIDPPGREVLTRSSSLRSDTFLPLVEGDSLAIELPAHEHLCGFMFNTATSDGVLRLSGSGGQADWCVSSFNRHKAARRSLAFISQVAPLPNWRQLTGRVRLQLVQSSEAARFVVGAEKREVTRAYLELGTLIVRRALSSGLEQRAALA